MARSRSAGVTKPMKVSPTGATTTAPIARMMKPIRPSVSRKVVT